MELIKQIKNSQFNNTGVCLMTDGDVKEVKADKVVDGRMCFDIKKVKEALNIDLFEIVNVPSTEFILICDEEGLCKNDWIQNIFASILAKRTIVGNVMVCHTSMIN
jgi:hypothetical protein